MKKTRLNAPVYQLASDPNCPEYTLTYGEDDSYYWKWGW